MSNIIIGLNQKINRLTYERQNLREALYCFEQSYKRSDNKKVRSYLKSHISMVLNRLSEFDRVVSILGLKEEIEKYEARN